MYRPSVLERKRNKNVNTEGKYLYALVFGQSLPRARGQQINHAKNILPLIGQLSVVSSPDWLTGCGSYRLTTTEEQKQNICTTKQNINIPFLWRVNNQLFSGMELSHNSAH